jgi:hypothetical protein
MASELSLADKVKIPHSDNPSVVRAYLRTTVMPKRVKIMQAWGRHCTPKTDTVTQFRAVA